MKELELDFDFLNVESLTDMTIVKETEDDNIVFRLKGGRWNGEQIKDLVKVHNDSLKMGYKKALEDVYDKVDDLRLKFLER